MVLSVALTVSKSAERVKASRSDTPRSYKPHLFSNGIIFLPNIRFLFFLVPD